MTAFIEFTDWYASGSRKQGHRNVFSVNTRITGQILFVIYVVSDNLVVPIGGDEAHFRTLFHDVANLLRQIVQDCRVRSYHLHFNRIFLVHDIVLLELYISVRIMGGQVILYLCHVLVNTFSGCERYNQFSIRQGWSSDTAHEIIAGRCPSKRGGDVGYFCPLFQIGCYFLQILFYSGIVGVFRKFILNVQLVVGHVWKESLLDMSVTDDAANNQ